jgi:tight adherence protein B
MSSILVSLAAGTGTGLGLVLMILGWRGVARSPGEHRPTPLLARVDRPQLRLALAGAGAVALWLLSGWPVAILLAGVCGFVAPTLAGAKQRRQSVILRTEAIAAWAEQLRDTIGSAAGLQEAISVTARVAPVAIRPAIKELAAGMRRNNLSDELRRLADALDDPTADQVVVALILASERRGQNLTRLLSDVAAAAREEATMRIRTETSRAQTYNDAKVVSGVVIAMFGFMLVFNRRYLAPFDSLAGQGVLAVVGGFWALAVYGLAQLSTVRQAPRLLTVGRRNPAPGLRVG